MKHTKLLVVALLVALLACLCMSAMADECLHPTRTQLVLLSPTCVTKGVGVVQCTTCGKQLDTYDIPATGIHTWTAPETKEPDCGHDGYTKRSCTVCGYAETTVIPASGKHDFSAIYAPKVEPTCIEAGAKPWYMCSVCGKLGPKPEVIPAYGHDFDGQPYSIVIRPANCITEGLVARKCKYCDELDIISAGLGKHADGWYNYDPKTATMGGGYTLPYKKNTCTTAGCTAVYQCPICGATKGGEAIAPSGHDVNGVEWTVKRGATCAVDGILVRYCKKCNAEVESQNVGKISGHSDPVFVAGKTTVSGITVSATEGYIIPPKAPTCTTNGCTAVYQCKVCGATKGGDVIPAPGHKIAESAWSWKNGVVADCTTTGVRQGTCSVCGKVASEVTVPAYGHSAVWQVSEVATPTKTGMAILKCTRCGNTIGMQILKYGDATPSGAVNTGAAAAPAASTAKSSKTSSTKSSSAKTTTTKTTSTSSSKAATTEKKVEVASALPTLTADMNGKITVKNGDKDIELSVMVNSGKIVVVADLAEDESLVLYKDEAAIDAPTAENTMVLKANDLVDLPDEFASAIVAIVKTASLPEAVRASL